MKTLPPAQPRQRDPGQRMAKALFVTEIATEVQLACVEPQFAERSTFPLGTSLADVFGGVIHRIRNNHSAATVITDQSHEMFGMIT
jgi:hypothetical protein